MDEYFVSLDVLSVDFFFFSSRRRHTRFDCDWSSDVCSSDLHVLTWHDAMPWPWRQGPYLTCVVVGDGPYRNGAAVVIRRPMRDGPNPTRVQTHTTRTHATMRTRCPGRRRPVGPPSIESTLIGSGGSCTHGFRHHAPRPACHLRGPACLRPRIPGDGGPGSQHRQPTLLVRGPARLPAPGLQRTARVRPDLLPGLRPPHGPRRGPRLH